MQGQINELAARGLGLAVISYDPPEVLTEFSRRRGITYPLLSDPNSATIQAYGILNTVAEEVLGPGKDDPVVIADFNLHASVLGLSSASHIKGTPYPGTFIVDAEGRVRSRYFEEFYRERITVSTILMRFGAASPPVEAQRFSDSQVTITSWSGDSVISPGNRFALAVNIVPAPHVHVYAPGASGYRTVKLGVQPQEYVRVLPVQYPPSENWLFEPLQETAPVYQKSVTLLQEVVLEVSPEALQALAGKTELMLKGTLEYQACDDKQCFNPVSVPLSWNVRIVPNIKERIRTSST